MTSTVPTYLELGFKSNAQEAVYENVVVKGSIPQWLEGSLIRNGPGVVHANKPMKHWFDGLAMLHKFNIHHGRVSYQSRYIDCDAYRSYKQTGQFLYSDFATDPCRSLFGKIQTLFSKDPMITDSAKVNVGSVNGGFYALGEPLMQVRIDPKTLKSLGVFDYGLTARSRMTTAHPHIDGHQTFNLVVEYGPINYYSIYTMGSDSKKVASVPVYEPGYIHSFGMTENYFIIAEFPLVVQSLKLAFRLKPFIENFHWKPSNGSRFIIIDRKTGKRKATVKCDAFFSFHHVNAFEIGNRLVVDMATYEDASIIESYYINRLSNPSNKIPFGRMERFELDLNSQKLLSRKVVSNECIELPNIEYHKRHGDANYKFVYGCGMNDESPEGFYNQLVRIDMSNGASLKWYESGCYPGEPVFVSSPDGVSEDDGVLLSVVLDPSYNRSFLLVLNAKTMKECARAELPLHISFGYHGTFLNETDFLHD
ncbi:MAG: carotenoid oxygenase family protein [Bacteroidota bacterium]